MRKKLLRWSVFLLLNTLFSAQAWSNPASTTIFEADPVRPVATLKKSSHVLALNIPDDYLEIFHSDQGQLNHCGEVKLGMRPVALAIVSEEKSDAVIWVVNQASDSINVVNLNLNTCQGEVVDTILTGDEPRDIVVANTYVGPRVLVTMAHRGQNHPDELARDGFDLTRSATQNTQLSRPTGLGDLVVFDPNTAQAIQVINLNTTKLRALSLAPANEQGRHDTVYVAGFLTGNRTSVVAAETARGAAVEHLHHLIEEGSVAEDANGKLIVTQPGTKMYGGTPAIQGIGRCTPDPRSEFQRRHELQICAQTDQNHNLIAFHPQDTGQITPECSCTDSSGEIQPVISQMVKYFDDPAICGDNFDSKLGGCWLDQDPAYSTEMTPVMAWNELMKFTLPDNDIFQLRFDATGKLHQEKSFQGIGNVIFSMVTHPRSGDLIAVNQDANNMTRFEGFSHFANSTVRGQMALSQITVVNENRITVQNINDHLWSGNKNPANSLAFPVSAAITHHKNILGQTVDDQTLYFAALGSDAIGYIKSGHLNESPLNPHIQQFSLSRTNGTDKDEMSGPVGMVIRHQDQRLYVLARFSNELIEIDISGEQPVIVSRHVMNTPEPDHVVLGRSTLYDARNMSANGDQSCASCHIFGDGDGLAWDLSNPDNASINNYGPFVSPPMIGFVSDLAIDPWQADPKHAAVNPDFRAIKGPMLTQPLRGVANHGATHWRGDRVKRVQYTYGQQPDTGAFDERSSIIEFDESVIGLVGGDAFLAQSEFDYIADYILELTYPPNPIRNLDNSLTDLQNAGRAAFFGCLSMTDEQFLARQCIGMKGQLVNIDQQTESCECYGNPIRFVMDRFSYVTALAAAVNQLTINADLIAAPNDYAQLNQRLTLLQMEASVIADLTPQPLATLAAPGNQAANNYNAQVFNLTQLDQIRNWLTGASYPEHRVGLLGFIENVAQFDKVHQTSVLADLLSQLDLQIMPLQLRDKFYQEASIVSAIEELSEDSNVAKSAVIDARLMAGQEQNVLGECAIRQSKNSCELRIADSLTTCQGCHVLDPEANQEFAVNKSGLFGTNGKYSFSNIPQVFKVPHLRNLYDRTGKFGQPYEFDMFVGQSVFGIYKGGFFDKNPPNEGASIRGYGYSHDGSADTVHRFAGLLDFLRRPAGTLGGDDVRGNPDAFDAFLPINPEQCLQQVAMGTPEFLAPINGDMDQLLPIALAAVSGDKTSAMQLVETVLTSPGTYTDPRWLAISRGAREALEQGNKVSGVLASPIVEALTAGLVCPSPPDDALMPLCFQLGSTLESGDKDGACYPSGLLEREAGEAFMMAFDTNLKPMVGQQITLSGALTSETEARLNKMFYAASNGHCDIAGVQMETGYLVSQVNADTPQASLLEDSSGQSTTLEKLLQQSVPLTFVCYPPKDQQQEARQAVFGRTLAANASDNIWYKD